MRHYSHAQWINSVLKIFGDFLLNATSIHTDHVRASAKPILAHIRYLRLCVFVCARA